MSGAGPNGRFGAAGPDKNGGIIMKTNRSLLKFILLTAITFGIYGLYFYHSYARDMNIVCEGDGKHTRGLLAVIVFSFLTLGIYGFVWMYGVGERISMNCQRRGIPNNTTGSSVLLWNLLGALIIVGPFVALHQMLDGLNMLCADYNRTHGTVAAGNAVPAGNPTVVINNY